jgi:hypothetical protein
MCTKGHDSVQKIQSKKWLLMTVCPSHTVILAQASPAPKTAFRLADRPVIKRGTQVSTSGRPDRLGSREIQI